MVARVANNKYLVASFPLKLLQLRGNSHEGGDNSPPVHGVLACAIFDDVFCKHFIHRDSSCDLKKDRRKRMLEKCKTGTGLIPKLA